METFETGISAKNKCCTRLVAENMRLAKALEKERQRRRYIATAYKKLLDAYRSAIDMKEILETSASSIEENKESDNIQSNVSFEEKPDEKENQPQKKPKVSILSPSRRENAPPIIVTRASPKAIVEANKPKSVSRTSVGTNEWYFLALEDELEIKRKIAERAKVENLLRKSKERSQMIATASQRRAAIAANRRAVAVDVLKGKRELDDEALRILHTDSSRISAFPSTFMQEMAEKAKRRYLQSQLRLEREKGNMREKHLEMATNNVLAHSSASIAKAVANLRFSRTYSHLTAERRSNC